MAAALCDGVRGGGAQLAFHVQAGNYDTDSLIGVLDQLRKFLGGEKATLLWDGLPAHRSRAMRDFLNRQLANRCRTAARWWRNRRRPGATLGA
jgi:hypothetical protein